MANGSIQQQVSAQYLQAFNLPIGVSGMQKLQTFPALQQLGYAGQLSLMKADFHGLADFKSQMSVYSSISPTLTIAWNLIKAIVPNNANILAELFTAPGLGTVGLAFQSISGFGQVFALTPSNLQSPSATTAATSVYQNTSTQANVVTSNSGSTSLIGGGAGLTTPGNANQINGLTIVGMPTLTNNSLLFNGTNLTWGPAGSEGIISLGGAFDVNDGVFPSPEQSFFFDDGDF